MRFVLCLTLLVACGASTALNTNDLAPDASPVRSCLPPCLARALAPCAPPTGVCVAYITAALDNWRRCFDNGLVIEAQPVGAHRYRQGTRICAAVSSRAAATVDVDTWSDATGAVLATVTRRQASRDAPWSVTCEGATFVVDPRSAECAADPWVRARNPHALPCPLGPRSDECRDAR